ncbi:MAG TPA: entericidin A/B family lipoprotein [Advenella sp.]|nr:entericidin A/B family lipoprotein [Advenella sp.]
MKKLGLVAVLVSLLGLAACNTISGAGQDLQRGGAAISGAAERHK